MLAITMSTFHLKAAFFDRSDVALKGFSKLFQNMSGNKMSYYRDFIDYQVSVTIYVQCVKKLVPFIIL